MKFFSKSYHLFKRKQIFDDISGYEEEKWVVEKVKKDYMMKVQ